MNGRPSVDLSDAMDAPTLRRVSADQLQLDMPQVSTPLHSPTSLAPQVLKPHMSLLPQRSVHCAPASHTTSPQLLASRQSISQLEPAAHVTLHVPALRQSMLQLAPVWHDGSQLSAPLQSMSQTPIVPHDGLHVIAPLQSKLHVLLVPQLAVQDFAPPQATSHWQLTGQLRLLQVAPAAQVTAEHTPEAHTSPVVHASPSSHAKPSFAGMISHWLAASLHTPELHWPATALQSRGVPPLHAPWWHLSLTVQNRPSLHGALPLAGLVVQRSVMELQ